MSLTSLSIDTLLSLWSDLDDALHGVNDYGGDTAEIYAYRFEAHCPTRYLGPCSIQKETEAADAASSARALYALLIKFETERCCRVYVVATDGSRQRLGRWLAKRPFTHRVHVLVRAKKP